MIKNMRGLKYGGNMYVILIYDIIMDEESGKVTRNIFKISKKYLTHIQKSVFEGEVTPALLEKMKMELKKHLREDKDSVIIFESREKRWLKKEFLGKLDTKTSNFF